MELPGATITGSWWALHRVEGVHDPTADFAAGLVQDVGMWALCRAVSRLLGHPLIKVLLESSV